MLLQSSLLQDVFYHILNSKSFLILNPFFTVFKINYFLRSTYSFCFLHLNVYKFLHLHTYKVLDFNYPYGPSNSWNLTSLVFICSSLPIMGILFERHEDWDPNGKYPRECISLKFFFRHKKFYRLITFEWYGRKVVNWGNSYVSPTLLTNYLLTKLYYNTTLTKV